jgi:muramoyltetrapeptide carboxypeptidase
MAKASLVSFSGPLLATSDSYGGAKGIDPFTEAGLWLWLSPGTWPRPLANPPGAQLQVLRPGQATGRLVGGNLSLVAGLVGTPYLPDLHGAILVLEDVDEVPYRVDRMLTQLLLAGHFDEIAGVVVGDFANCFPPKVKDDGPPFEELLLERLGERQIPVVSGLAYGHIRRKCTVPLGAMAELNTDPPSLTVLGPAPAVATDP